MVSHVLLIQKLCFHHQKEELWTLRLQQQLRRHSASPGAVSACGNRFFCWQAIINWLQESNVCPIEFWRNGLFEHLLVQRIPISCASHIFETCASYSNLVSKSSSVNLGHDHHSEWLRVVPVVFVPKMRIYPNDPQCTAIFMGKTGCETMRILGATFLIIIFPWPMVYNCL